MTFDPYLVQLLARERMRDAMRQAERVRLIQVAEGAAVAERAALPGRLTRTRNLVVRLISVNRIQSDVPAPQQCWKRASGS